MKTLQYRLLIALLLSVLAASTIWGAAQAVSDSPAQMGESIRARFGTGSIIFDE